MDFALRCRFALCLALIPLTSFGRETLHLRNGYTIEADSHQLVDGTFVIQMGSGRLTLPATEVESIQALPDLPSPVLPFLAPKERPIADLLRDAAVAQGIDGAFVRSVAIVESGLRQSALSKKGARGLMQLMPDTAGELRVDASKADENALGGAMYLRKLLLAYNGDSGLALAAYNAGPGAVKRYGGIPPYRETRDYVVKVLREYNRQVKLLGLTKTSANSAPHKITQTATSMPSATN